jgi:hypothetical protein
LSGYRDSSPFKKTHQRPSYEDVSSARTSFSAIRTPQRAKSTASSTLQTGVLFECWSGVPIQCRLTSEAALALGLGLGRPEQEARRSGCATEASDQLPQLTVPSDADAVGTFRPISSQ